MHARDIARPRLATAHDNRVGGVVGPPLPEPSVISAVEGFEPSVQNQQQNCHVCITATASPNRVPVKSMS